MINICEFEIYLIINYSLTVIACRCSMLGGCVVSVVMVTDGTTPICPDCKTSFICSNLKRCAACNHTDVYGEGVERREVGWEV